MPATLRNGNIFLFLVELSFRLLILPQTILGISHSIDITSEPMEDLLVLGKEELSEQKAKTFLR